MAQEAEQDAKITHNDSATPSLGPLRNLQRKAGRSGWDKERADYEPATKQEAEDTKSGEPANLKD